MNATDPLEARLTSTLARAANTIEPEADAWARFQQRLADEPQNRADVPASAPAARANQRAGKRKLFLAAAAAAAVGMTAFGASSLTGNTAYASWDHHPDVASSADEAAMARVCGVKAPAVVDRRGHNAFVVAQQGNSWVGCLGTLPGLSDEGLGQQLTETTPKNAVNTKAPTGSAPIVVTVAKAPEGNHVNGAPAPAVFVGGRVASSVARVDVSTSQGNVVATVDNGYFAAWWPGNDTDTAVVRAYDAHGKEIASVRHLDRIPKG